MRRDHQWILVAEIGREVHHLGQMGSVSEVFALKDLKEIQNANISIPTSSSSLENLVEHY